MKKITRVLASVGTTLFAAMLLCAGNALSVSAEGSVEDVYAAMRRIGLPETMIQEAKNQYQSVPHDENGMTINGRTFTYEEWAELVEIMEEDIWKAVANQFPDVTPGDITPTTPPATSTLPAGTGSTGASQDSGTTTVTTTVSTEQFAIVTDKPFASMTLEEKQAYVASLPADQRGAFLGSLSIADRNSIIKQMDKDSLTDLAQSFINFGQQFGMNITVDKIGSGNLNYSVRDEEGKLIESAGVGLTVDDTGWNLTAPILISAGTILLSLTGFAWMTWQTGKKKEEANG